MRYMTLFVEHIISIIHQGIGMIKIMICACDIEDQCYDMKSNAFALHDIVYIIHKDDLTLRYG